jgi:hypothetical protein
MQTRFVLSFVLLCTGCAEASGDAPSAFPGGYSHAASFDTPPAHARVVDREAVVREPLAPRIPRDQGDYVRCSMCR